MVWTPNPASRYEIFFPAPKLAHLISTVGNHNVWAYVRGEYGGGAWTVERPVFGGNDEFEYDDIRVAVGLDFLPRNPKRPARLPSKSAAHSTAGSSTAAGMPGTTNLDDTFLIGGGLIILIAANIQTDTSLSEGGQHEAVLCKAGIKPNVPQRGNLCQPRPSAASAWVSVFDESLEAPTGRDID